MPQETLSPKVQRSPAEIVASLMRATGQNISTTDTAEIIRPNDVLSRSYSEQYLRYVFAYIAATQADTELTEQTRNLFHQGDQIFQLPTDTDAHQVGFGTFMFVRDEQGQLLQVRQVEQTTQDAPGIGPIPLAETPAPAVETAPATKRRKRNREKEQPRSYDFTPTTEAIALNVLRGKDSAINRAETILNRLRTMESADKATFALTLHMSGHATIAERVTFVDNMLDLDSRKNTVESDVQVPEWTKGILDVATQFLKTRDQVPTAITEGTVLQQYDGTMKSAQRILTLVEHVISLEKSSVQRHAMREALAKQYLSALDARPFDPTVPKISRKRPAAIIRALHKKARAELELTHPWSQTFLKQGELYTQQMDQRPLSLQHIQRQASFILNLHADVRRLDKSRKRIIEQLLNRKFHRVLPDMNTDMDKVDADVVLEAHTLTHMAALIKAAEKDRDVISDLANISREDYITTYIQQAEYLRQVLSEGTQRLGLWGIDRRRPDRNALYRKIAPAMGISTIDPYMVYDVRQRLQNARYDLRFTHDRAANTTRALQLIMENQIRTLSPKDVHAKPTVTKIETFTPKRQDRRGRKTTTPIKPTTLGVLF